MCIAAEGRKKSYHIYAMYVRTAYILLDLQCQLSSNFDRVQKYASTRSGYRQELESILYTYSKNIILVIDHFLNDLDNFNPFFSSLLTLNLERSALRLVQNVGTEQRRQVVRVHLVAWQLYDVTTLQLL